MKKSKYFENVFHNDKYGIAIFKNMIAISEYGKREDLDQVKQYIYLPKKQFKELIHSFNKYEKR